MAGVYFFSLICFSICLLAQFVVSTFLEMEVRVDALQFPFFQNQIFYLAFLKAIRSVTSVCLPRVFKNLFKLPVPPRILQQMHVCQLLHRRQNSVHLYLG